MATIGIGDYNPAPASMWEALAALVYFSLGIVLLSALCLSIAYYFQCLFYVTLRESLHALCVRHLKRYREEEANGVGGGEFDTEKAAQNNSNEDNYDDAFFDEKKLVDEPTKRANHHRIIEEEGEGETVVVDETAASTRKAPIG